MGMRKLFLAWSQAQETLDHMDKGIDVADVPAILGYCRDAGIAFHLFSIVGFQRSPNRAPAKRCGFLDNHHLINHPANSFDIHPFGLELRTPYAEAPEAVGIVFHLGARQKDFAIGVNGDADAFDEHARAIGLVLATHGGLVMNTMLANDRARNMEQALESNREIGVAIGVLMHQHRLSRNQAFDVLRAASQDSNRKLRDIAQEVVNTGTLTIRGWPASSGVRLSTRTTPA